MELNLANEKEKIITEMEIKKRQLSNKLKKHINDIKLNPNQFIKTKSAC